MSYRKHALLVVSSLLLSWAAPASAQVVTVRFEPDQFFLLAGESVFVEVHVDGVPSAGIAAFQLEVLFDAASLSAADPNAGSGLDAFGPLGSNPLCAIVRGAGTCEDSIWLLTSTGRVPSGTTNIDNIAGEVLIAYGTSGAPAPPAGSGAIAIVEFLASSSTPSTVRLANVIISDASNPPMPYSLKLEPASVNSVDVPALGEMRFLLLLALALAGWRTARVSRTMRSKSG